jgi:nitronate monooxygenase
VSPSPVISRLTVPVIQAPMAGGPSTPELAAAVGRGGGLGFLAAGYLSAERLAQDIARTRALGCDRFGVNVFVGGGSPADPELVDAFARRLSGDAARVGVELGAPHFDDDHFDEKVAVLYRDPVTVASFTFGAPPPEAVDRLHAVGSEVWMTVTSPAEAKAAVGLGADALVVQGVEAGGHRGVFVDDDAQSDLTLLAALQLIAAVTDLPLVASGAIMTGAALAAALVAGAAAGQLGSAFLRSTEAGTSDAHREAVAGSRPTVLTRAFSGRLARGVTNRWHEQLGSQAPHAYPEIHHLTSPLRAYGRRVGDPDLINLWAGQAHQLAPEQSAEAITAQLGRDAAAAVAGAANRLATHE